MLCWDFIAPLGYLCYIKFWVLSPKMEVPESYWVGYVEKSLQKFQVTSLETEVVFGEMNMFVHTSLIQYTIKGIFKLSEDKGLGVNPAVEKIHVTQKYLPPGGWNSSTRENGPEALVELVPIVGRRQGSAGVSAEGVGENSFSITNQMTVTSLHMGENTIRFQSGDYWEDLHLYQTK